MKTKVLSLVLILFVGLFLVTTAVFAHGDGYTGCGQDPVYTKDFIGVTKIGSNVRNTPCMSGSTVLKVLPSNYEIRVIAQTDGWYKVKDSDGTVGWVGSTLIEKTYKETVSNTTESTTKVSTESTTQISDRLKGYILLQVESAGEAWYVNPTDGKRYYMKDGSTAFNMMRDFGLGISNSNFSKLSAGNWELKNKLKGKIVLKVEANGEAYYVHPVKLTIHYLKDGDAAFNIMRNLSLGIKNSDLTKIASNTLEAYQTAEDLKQVAGVKETSSQNGTIKLNASADNGKVYLNWSLTDMTSPKGFKVVYSKNLNPVYPGNTYHYLTDPNTRTDTWSGLSAGTYYFRVCEYLGGACGVYSNNAVVTIEQDTYSSNGSISLNATEDNGKVYLNWSLTDMYSSKGFKVVYSKNMNPVYPGNTYHYKSDPNTRTDSWSGLSEGTYYFRVCEYLGGSCGVYSNNAVITIEQDTSYSNGSISLEALTATNGTVFLTWELADMTSPQGFKVVVSENPNPVYPGNTYHYKSDQYTRSDVWENLSSGTYHFRVCEYLGGRCGVYSNDVEVNL